ncbi:MAG: hypothetical protein ACTIMZ_16135 [Pseudoalteromonas distincta]|uniref:hypothetical protein n=1 Tax=Pseudoalteromonas distincta TaxID=77608 RepID=UPI003F97D9C6
MATAIKALAVLKSGMTVIPHTIEWCSLHNDVVQFDILYCGIYHSDLHQINNDFGSSR